MAPYVGALWTPATGDGVAAATSGTLATGAASIGYYGGINYGFGYFGTGLLRRILGWRPLLLQPRLRSLWPRLPWQLL